MYNTLKTLCMIPSVSGREDAVRDKLRQMISPLTDENYTDNLGNLIAVKRGTGKSPKKIMLCAHMDEIGFLVTYIEDKGFIRVSCVGGINLVAASNGVSGAWNDSAGNRILQQCACMVQIHDISPK